VTNSASLVDFIWTLDGHALLPSFPAPDNILYYSHTARPATRTWTDLSPSEFAAAPSPFYKVFSGAPQWAVLKPSSATFDRARVFSIVRGVVSLMLSRIAPRPLAEDQVNGYYLSAI
jgi:hypothetical protein